MMVMHCMYLRVRCIFLVTITLATTLDTREQQCPWVEVSKYIPLLSVKETMLTSPEEQYRYLALTQNHHLAPLPFQYPLHFTL